MEIKRGTKFRICNDGPDSPFNGVSVSVVKAPMAVDGGRIELKLLEDVWNTTGTIVRKKGEKITRDLTRLEKI